MQAVGALGFAVLVAAALAAGPAVLGVVVVLAAALALLDTAVLFGRTGVRLVLPVAAIPGVALPVLAVLEGGADPGLGWARVGELFAVAVIAGFTLVIVFGRRRGIVVGLGATLAVGLLVGLGAASLVLLHALPEGVRWVLVLVVLVAAADAAAPAALALQARRRREPAEEERGQGEVVPLLAALGAVAVVSGVLALVLEPPPALWVGGVLGAAVAVAALGGDHLRRVLAVEAGLGPEPTGLGTGMVFGAVDGLLLAAPVAYVLARSVVL